MSISSTSRKAGPYSGNDVATAFAFAFKVFSAADVLVVFTSAIDVETDLTLGTDYTVTLNSNQDSNPGGTVTLPAALVTGTKLTITSDLSNLQPVTLTNNGGFYPTVINDALDRATIQIQQLAEGVSRAVKTDISSAQTADYLLNSIAASQAAAASSASDALASELSASGHASDAAASATSASDSATAATAATTFTQAGAGATPRTYQNKMRDLVNVRDFGAIGDGTTDDTSAFSLAITAATGKTLYIPDPASSYKITGSLAIPANTKICGDNKRTTRVKKFFTGDLFTLGDGAAFSDLWIDGNGAGGYTGRGILLTSTDGHQEVINCRVVDFEGFPVDYLTLAAGSQSAFINCELSQYTAPTGSASNVAVNMLAGVQVSAVPRTFIGIQTNGTPAFNFGGCNDVFVSNSFLGDLYYTANSRGVMVTGCRIANQASMVIDGHNNTIVGCDIAPQITIAGGSSADNIAITGNSYNILPIIDGSGNGRNQFSTFRADYTPTLTSGGTAPVLGNGVLSGIFSRNGSTVSYSIELTTGSTTTLGTGNLFLSLPVSTTSTLVQVASAVTLYNGTNFYSGVGILAALDNKVQLLRDTTGSVTFNSPSTWPSGSVFRVSGTYSI